MPAAQFNLPSVNLIVCRLKGRLTITQWPFAASPPATDNPYLLVLGGIFVLENCTLLVVASLEPFILELVVGAAVELVELLWSQPTMVKAANMVRTEREIIFFINF